MDQNSQKRFDELVSREPAAFTEDDITFLRARSSYLTSDQAAKFADVLGGKSSKPSKKKDTEDGG